MICFKPKPRPSGDVLYLTCLGLYIFQAVSCPQNSALVLSHSQTDALIRTYKGRDTVADWISKLSRWSLSYLNFVPAHTCAYEAPQKWPWENSCAVRSVKAKGRLKLQWLGSRPFTTTLRVGLDGCLDLKDLHNRLNASNVLLDKINKKAVGSVPMDLELGYSAANVVNLGEVLQLECHVATREPLQVSCQISEDVTKLFCHAESHSSKYPKNCHPGATLAFLINSGWQRALHDNIGFEGHGKMSYCLQKEAG